MTKQLSRAAWLTVLLIAAAASAATTRHGKSWDSGANPTTTKSAVSLPCSIDPTFGLVTHPVSGHLNALAVLKGNHAPPTTMYLKHIYFQPQHIKVLIGKSAFSGVAGVAGRLSDPASQRPGYLGCSRLQPAHAIALSVRVAHNGRVPELLISFGQEVAGRIQVRGVGGTLLVGTGEWKAEALNHPWGGVHDLRLVPGRTESTPYSAFRYALLRFKGNRSIKLNRLRLDFKYYPVAYRGAFACSDPLLTKAWLTGAYTAHLCMQEEVWDAPKRDRGMWMGDMQISGNVINNVFLSKFLPELTAGYLRERAEGDILPRGMPIGGEWRGIKLFNRPSGALPASDVNAIPGYSCAWICWLADFYRHSGAMVYLRYQHPFLLSMLSYMKRGFDSRNIFVNKHREWDFVDWSRHLTGGKTRNGASDTLQAQTNTDLYTCWAVRRAVGLLNALGDKTNAAKYARWQGQLVRAARKYLVNHKTGTYTRLTQPNAMAILSGVATPSQRAAINRLIFGVHQPFWNNIGTPYCMDFALRALGDLGHSKRAIRFAQWYWGGMLRAGATTFWETYRPGQRAGTMRYGTSLCHGWAAGVTSWLTEEVLGVKPDAGGFSRASIVPHLGGLKWASGVVPTPTGAMKVRVRKAQSGVFMHVVLPPGVRANVEIQGHSATLDGSPVAVNRGSSGRMRILLTQPGDYAIISR